MIHPTVASSGHPKVSWITQQANPCSRFPRNYVTPFRACEAGASLAMRRMRDLVSSGSGRSAGFVSTLEQPLYRLTHLFHFDRVIGLLPEYFPMGRTNHQSMVLETQGLDRTCRFRRGCVDVLRMYPASKFLLEPAHGRFDLSADRSAGKVVVGHIQWRRLSPASQHGKRRAQCEHPNYCDPGFSYVTHKDLTA